MEIVDAAALKMVLDDLVQGARRAFGADLRAVVLFGSAAESRLRPSSDVNLMLYLDRFEPSCVDEFRSALRVAHSAIRASVVFLLHDELPEAASLFAVKFNDIKTRHRILWGEDPFAMLEIDKVELRRRTREVLLNLSIRLRERYALISLREEQLVSVIANAAAPLRAAALALLDIQEGASALNPRDALMKIAVASERSDFVAAVEALSPAREYLALPVGVAGPVLLHLSELATYLLKELNTVGSAA